MKEIENLYQERLSRYTTALQNEKPDKIPIRPFAAEFTAKYAGYTCQEVTHDYNKAFMAVRKCALDFDWDAVVANSGKTNLYRNNVALVKGGMAMLQYFNDFGPQVDLLKNECGTVSAIAGILKAPFDILGDKLRGYMGLTMDMMSQPDKVLKACEALMPHLYEIALSSSDANKQVPIGYWMHRGCIPFVSEGEFESHYWPTMKPIGVCIPWENKLAEINEIKGDESLVESIWQNVDSFGHTFIWHCLLSF